MSTITKNKITENVESLELSNRYSVTDKMKKDSANRRVKIFTEKKKTSEMWNCTEDIPLCCCVICCPICVLSNMYTVALKAGTAPKNMKPNCELMYAWWQITALICFPLSFCCCRNQMMVFPLTEMLYNFYDKWSIKPGTVICDVML
jgi:hypothetical protein